MCIMPRVALGVTARAVLVELHKNTSNVTAGFHVFNY